MKKDKNRCFRLKNILKKYNIHIILTHANYLQVLKLARKVSLKTTYNTTFLNFFT